MLSRCILTNTKIYVTPEEYQILLNHQKILLKTGFGLIFKKKYVILNFIPCLLKIKDNHMIISDFFSFLFLKKKILISEIVNWFYNNIFIKLKSWNYVDGTKVLLEMEYYCPLVLQNPPSKLLQKINFDSALCALKI